MEGSVNLAPSCVFLFGNLLVGDENDYITNCHYRKSPDC